MPQRTPLPAALLLIHRAAANQRLGRRLSAVGPSHIACSWSTQSNPAPKCSTQICALYTAITGLHLYKAPACDMPGYQNSRSPFPSFSVSSLDPSYSCSALLHWHPCAGSYPQSFSNPFLIVTAFTFLPTISKPKHHRRSIPWGWTADKAVHVGSILVRQGPVRAVRRRQFLPHASCGLGAMRRAAAR